MLSLPADVDLSQLVLGHSLTEAEEIALAGGGSYAARAQRLKWTTAAADTATGSTGSTAAAVAAVDCDGDVNDGGEKAFAPPASNDDDDDGNKWTITLGPMEIKTYRLQLAPDRC